jgi:hypothetical protein
MPIPPLDRRGLLPEGIYEASIDDVKARFATSDYRIALFNDFLLFINNEVGSLNIPTFMAGSFLSDKLLPNDIEITMYVTLDDLKSLDGKKILQLGSKSEHDRFKLKYRIDFYISLEGANDFTLFFQYVGEKTANAKGIDTKDKRGIIRVLL